MSTQMRWDCDFDDDDYITAVAASAYAVQSLEESKARNRNETTYGPNKSWNKMRSKAENKEIWHGRSQSAPRLSNKHLNINDRKSHETSMPEPGRPSTGRSTTQLIETTGQSATKHGPGDSMADAWEKEEMASIRERYERLMATINNWQIKKKKRADRKLQSTKVIIYEDPSIQILEKKDQKYMILGITFQANLDKDIAKAMREVRKIEEIAGEARTLAEAKRKKEELKVEEKANKIRSTGKLPSTYLCF
ncbi:hypothetical protein OROGR_010211 [Orobanche gracilis]